MRFGKNELIPQLSKNVEKPLISRHFRAIFNRVNKITNLRGRVKFPTGGKVRDPLFAPLCTVQEQNG